MKGIVFDIKRYSIHDGPGLRTTVFLKGCPLRCAWCHNPESQKLEPQIVYYKEKCIGCLTCRDVCRFNAVDVSENGISINKNCTMCGECAENCPTNALDIIGREYEAQELADEILKDELFFNAGGGITISGGEPFVQKEFLFELLDIIKQRRIHIALDTTGYTDEELILKAAEYTDLFLYDLKHMDSLKHKQYTGVSNEKILNNLKSISAYGAKIAIRIPIVPSINDSYENMKQTAEFISQLKGIISVDLLPYHDMMADKYKRLKMPFLMGSIKKPEDEKMEELKKMFEDYGFLVNIGG